MGLLKDILKSVTGNVVSEFAEVIKRNVPLPGQPQQTKPQSQPQATRFTSDPEQPERTDLQWKEYFAEILATEFPLYSVQRNVEVTALTGPAEEMFQLYKTRPTQAYKAEWGAPYTFVLYQMGVPKGVVMLGSGHSHDSNVKYLISRMFAKKMGLPYINFYTQMPNERSYVVSRIRRFLPV